MIFDWDGVAAIVAAITAVGGGGYALVRQGMSLGKLVARVEELEVSKEKVESAHFLTVGNHDKIQAGCRSEIFRDIETLREDFKGLENFVKESESNRLAERKDDERRWRKTEDSLLEITMLLKLGLTGQRRSTDVAKGLPELPVTNR